MAFSAPDPGEERTSAEPPPPAANGAHPRSPWLAVLGAGDAAVTAVARAVTDAFSAASSTASTRQKTMQQRMADLQPIWQERGYARPFHMRIGINTDGPAHRRAVARSRPATNSASSSLWRAAGRCECYQPCGGVGSCRGVSRHRPDRGAGLLAMNYWRAPDLHQSTGVEEVWHIRHIS